MEKQYKDVEVAIDRVSYGRDRLLVLTIKMSQLDSVSAALGVKPWPVAAGPGVTPSLCAVWCRAVAWSST